MNRRIWLVTPTRDRVKNVLRLMESIRSHAEDPARVAVVFGIDYDDQASAEAVRAGRMALHCASNLWQLSPREFVRRQPPGSTCATYWHLALQDIPGVADEDLVMLCADDIVFDTQGFDQLMLEGSLDHGWLYYGADGYQSERRPVRPPGPLATHPWFTAKTVRVMDGLATGRWAIYNDTFTWLIFTSFAPPRVTYLPEIRTTHLWLDENPRNDAHRTQSFRALGEHGGAEARRRVEALKAAGCIPEDAAQREVVYLDGLVYRPAGHEMAIAR